jgi:hypothetical protein
METSFGTQRPGPAPAAWRSMELELEAVFVAAGEDMYV